MKPKIKLGAITVAVIVGLVIAGAFVSAAVRTTTSSSLSETKKGNTMAPTGMKCGDCNFDSALNVQDVVYLINYKFLTPAGPAPLPMTCVGDANGDGTINVTDVVFLINFLFLVPPGPAPGGCCG